MAVACVAAATIAALTGLAQSGGPLAGPSSGPTPTLTEGLGQKDRTAALPGVPVLEGSTVLLLGDSLAAGEGGRNYYNGTDDPHQRCHRSAAGWFSGTGAEVTNVACSRAIIRNLSEPQQHPEFNEHAEAAQLDAATYPAPDLTLVMLGGNDIRFAEVFNECVLSDVDCSTSLAVTGQALETANALSSRLAQAYSKVADTVKGRVILVPAYPQFFSEAAAECGRISPAEARFAVELTSALNRSLRAGVEEAARTHPNIHFVPTTEHALNGHGACDPDPYVHTVQPTALIGAAQQQSAAQELLHPTAEGYAQLTASLGEWLTMNPAVLEALQQPLTGTGR
ncbi:SGNH/GDSL hydrolase family protein [Paenarthrobacter nitroguajacolicus]|uniref:SGNH/GDSL hydrolase family protein n=1 Tax=Paenarthrobacter nitroguajacolicus TaxID=211146 RepID=UPI004054912E